MQYSDFLLSKIAAAPTVGLPDEVAPEPHETLFPHQSDAVRWAVRGGRRALFMSFGLGKTRCQLDLARMVRGTAGGCPVLIVLPLGVRLEFFAEAEAMGLTLAYVRSDAEADAAHAAGAILVTNYERVRDGAISAEYCAGLAAVLLDEASVLRGYGTKTYQTFLRLFREVPYRFVSTATPSPNKLKELIHYAAFLGVMDSGEALTRFFQRNSEKAGDLTLMPHREADFWAWVASWALFVTKPSDLGHSDDGYDLPDVEVVWHRVDVSHEGAGATRDGQSRLFRDAAVGVVDAAREKRDTLADRLRVAEGIVEAEDPSSRWLLWHHLEAERWAIEASRVFAGEVASVYGSQDIDERERRLIDFADGRGPRLLATKPEISGSGCNFQRHCHRNIFLGITYEFNDFIQAIHRTHRFGQAEKVEVHVIYADSEAAIVDTLQRKWAEHDHLTERMTSLVRERGLADAARSDGRPSRTMGQARRQVEGERFVAVHADCVEEVARMQSESVDLIHTSIPFSNQYEYSPSYNDFGHNIDDAAFFAQMGYLIPDLLRVLRPGRVAAVHVKDRIRFASVHGTGAPTVGRFSDKTADAFEAAGFVFFGRITVTTDVVRENNQTYRLGWTEMCKDGTKMGCGMSEYILLFRRLPSDTSKGYADVPVTHDKAAYTRARWQMDAHGLWRSSGNRLLRPDELSQMEAASVGAWWRQYSAGEVYDYGTHLGTAAGLDGVGRLPSTYMMLAPEAPASEDVWTDIARMRTLNSEQSRRREEQHVCPLQLDIVERVIERFTNPGETVLDPFGGLMTVPYTAVKMGRQGIGVELNGEYFRMGLSYLRGAEADATAPTLFDAPVEVVG